jgi:ATP-binding cassette, subfamily C, bacterial LapB
VRQIDPGDLRSNLTLLSQSPRLFWGSLRDNLALASNDRTLDDAGFMAALRRFGMDDFVNAHPQGLSLRLGEDGQGLSGGQKQLVGLARLVLRDPAVALLDEPTSGLDQGTEHHVLQALAQWSRDGERTLVVVTHRPQVLDIVDRIVVLERGRVVMDGPKAQVLQALAQGVTVAAGAKRGASPVPVAPVAPVTRTGS